MRALQPDLIDLLKPLAAQLAAMNNNPGRNADRTRLEERVNKYLRLMDQPLSDIDRNRLPAAGLLLRNEVFDDDQLVAKKEIPELPIAMRSDLGAVLDLHVQFSLATREGQEALAVWQLEKLGPGDIKKFRATLLEVARAAQTDEKVTDPVAGDTLLEAAEAAGKGPMPPRSDVTAIRTVANYQIALMASVPAAVGALTVIDLLFGAAVAVGTAVIGGKVAEEVIKDVIKNSKRYIDNVRDPLIAIIDYPAAAHAPSLKQIWHTATARLRRAKASWPNAKILMADDESFAALAGSYAWQQSAQPDPPMFEPDWDTVPRPSAAAPFSDDPDFSWADGGGRDRYGVFATLLVPGEAVWPIEQRLRWIPPGTFIMGSPREEEGRFDYEGPQHEVTFTRGFWLFDTACTEELWEAVTGQPAPGARGSAFPVTNVSWNDAQAFIAALEKLRPGLGLTWPSEAQWEYACRAGTTTPYHFGEAITPKLARYESESPVPVANLPPNEWGLYEMHGNVWEWCIDSRADSYDTTPELRSSWEANGTGGARGIARGGSFKDAQQHLQAPYRLLLGPDVRNSNLGFRCARV